MEQLEQRLKQDGNKWRNKHKKELKNGNVKIHHPSPRIVADMLESRLHFGIIANDDEKMERGQVSFHDPDSGTYKGSSRLLKKLATCVERTLTTRQQKEVLNYLFLDSSRLTETREKWLIPVNNGVYNQHTHELEPFTPNYVLRHKIMTNYNANATEPTFNGWSLSNWFNEIAGGDNDKLLLLWQTLSAVINPNLTTDVAIFLVDSGQGRTGKSTFERLLENLVGAGNYGALKLKDFEDDFKLASATGKALIIGDDNNPNDFNRTNENFKSVATGENVLINPKGVSPFNYRFNNFIIQSMNGIPRFSDTSKALFRRFRVIVFDHQYKATAANKRIKDEYIKDKRLLEFILKKALTMTPDTLQDTEKSREIIEDIKEDNDSVAYFISHYLSELESTRIPVSFFFKYFLAAMGYENNPQKLKQKTFTRRAKPLMERKGWNYSRNSLAPLSYWNDSDMDKLDHLDPSYKYSVKIAAAKYQPLFDKTNKNKEKPTY
jgi:putative DNA primase/helicase